MKQYYKDQTIIAINWPPRIGNEFFGRLALVEKQNSSTQNASAWHLLRGQVDRLLGNNIISYENLVQPTDSALPLRVVIDGPPGIGKTTLCHKLMNMWSEETLVHLQHNFKLVLHCPLNNSKIATATTLADLFVHPLNEYKNVPEWFVKRDGKGLLIIFDGWDELSKEGRKSSLAASIICKEKLNRCSVIVTSRSYASSSLLELPNLSRHVQVIGFSEKEISTVIIQTLQKDPKLAKELIDENRNAYSHFKTIQSSEDSRLAVKLINDLKVRNDVQSLCYVPLVCSMVILVCKEGGHLPTTLTQLYENFILQTIRRQHAERHDNNINPDTLDSLSSLQAKPLQELCQLAYTNLANTRMTFSSHEIQSLSEAVKEDYLGLMTTFMEYDEEKYQFLHLSIQEFLAAWWIAKHEKKTEEVFKNHFDDDHFRMCLRFVAGLTHLEHESYQQYFKIQQLDLQCKRKPLFGFDICHFSYFYRNPDITVNFDHVSSDDFENVPILLLQLLYESQNTTLCQVLAQSINNSHSLCLDRVKSSLSLFDWFCFSYCIKNSNTTWNHLHLGRVSDQPRVHDAWRGNQPLSVFTAGLTNNSLQTQCKRLEVKLLQRNDELLQNFLQPSLLYNIQECYCVCVYYNGHFDASSVLLKFLNLPQLKLLHIRVDTSVPIGDPTDECTELEICIANNSTLEEMKIGFASEDEIAIVSVIKGVTRNKTITSLTLNVFSSFPLLDEVIGQLLKDNDTLTALSLDMPNHSQPSSLNIVKVNTPLTALEIGPCTNNTLVTSLLPHIKGLHCLILHVHRVPYQTHELLFLSHPSLHILSLPIFTAESAIELFTILQTNTTLKALRVSKMFTYSYTSQDIISVGNSLQEMLTKNQSLKYFEITDSLTSSLLSFLTNGIIQNTSLQQLHVWIPPNDIRTFLDVISQKNNLTELNMHLEDRDTSFNEQVHVDLLLAFTSMLQSHTTIRLLKSDVHVPYQGPSNSKWKEVAQDLFKAIFTHPSLEYIKLYGTLSLLKDTFKDQKKTLIDRYKEQRDKPLPMVIID